LVLLQTSVLLDVRSPGEFLGGKIKGAKNIDALSQDFMNQIKNLPKDKTYLIYCRSGNRT